MNRRIHSSILTLGTVAVVAGLLGLANPAGASAASAKSASQKAAAKKTLLALSDMPKGWTSAKDSGDGSSNFPGAKQLAGCIGVSSSLIQSNPPQVNSPDFHSADQSLEIDDSVAVFPSAKKAVATFNAMANPKTPACMITLMNGPLRDKIAKSAGSGATVGTVSVTRFSAPAHTTGLTISLPITASNQSITASITILTFVKGALSQQITFDSYGASFPSALALHVIAVAQKRL
ncbi:MAG TPA: hypothetical protein VHV57_21135 [Acidimicrobiales bacterium]|jgi:hypothetical protein|nr:hypothetical protein [Acidimicrobiales bacterium]